MTYASAESLRQALEHRLRERSSVTGLPIDRLRRRVLTTIATLFELRWATASGARTRADRPSVSLNAP